MLSVQNVVFGFLILLWPREALNFRGCFSMFVSSWNLQIHITCSSPRWNRAYWKSIKVYRLEQQIYLCFIFQVLNCNNFWDIESLPKMSYFPTWLARCKFENWVFGTNATATATTVTATATAEPTLEVLLFHRRTVDPICFLTSMIEHFVLYWRLLWISIVVKLLNSSGPSQFQVLHGLY